MIRFLTPDDNKTAILIAGTVMGNGPYSKNSNNWDQLLDTVNKPVLWLVAAFNFFFTTIVGFFLTKNLWMSGVKISDLDVYYLLLVFFYYALFRVAIDTIRLIYYLCTGNRISNK
jgi:hypothetical protein